ncbi:MAG: gliding motility protein GldN [Chlorobi bacterium]|nr:gliding motility protein GldN [Chlorobiota bacterium]
MKKLLYIVLLVFVTGSMQAQINILNASKPQEIGKPTPQQIKEDHSRPLPYPYTDDKDVLWSIQVWEKIDLDERFNLPLYYPTDSLHSSPGQVSLFDALMAGIKSGEITEVYVDDYFTEKLDSSALKEAMFFTDTMEAGIDQYNYEGKVDEEYIRHFKIQAADVEEYHIRGVWYFDAKYGELRYRLIGIAPVVYDLRARAKGMDAELIELFWIFFPDARKTLHKYYAINPRNAAKPLNYDHMLNGRFFTTIIYKTSNEYGDRSIRDYIHDDALKQLLESNKIKEMIRDYEEDQWNY